MVSFNFRSVVLFLLLPLWLTACPYCSACILVYIFQMVLVGLLVACGVAWLCSACPPAGTQVDGVPPARHAEAVQASWPAGVESDSRLFLTKHVMLWYVFWVWKWASIWKVINAIAMLFRTNADDWIISCLKRHLSVSKVFNICWCCFLIVWG